MKRTYKKPVAQMVDYRYDTQVTADSGETKYCFYTAWEGTLADPVCSNPTEWIGSPALLEPPATT